MRKAASCCIIAFVYAVTTTFISWLSSAAIIQRNATVPLKPGQLVDPVTGVIDSFCHFLLAFLSWFAVGNIARVVSSIGNQYTTHFITSIEDGSRHSVHVTTSHVSFRHALWRRLLIPARSALLRAVICGLIAVFIDLDHFIEAQSMSLDDVAVLEERPFFHNSFIEVGLVVLFAFVYWTKGRERPQSTSSRRRVNAASSLSYIAIGIVAFTTQHIRDSQRRGFTFRLCRHKEECSFAFGNREWNTPACTYPAQAAVAFALVLLCGLGTA